MITTKVKVSRHFSMTEGRTVLTSPIKSGKHYMAFKMLQVTV